MRPELECRPLGKLSSPPGQYFSPLKATRERRIARSFFMTSFSAHAEHDNPIVCVLPSPPSLGSGGIVPKQFPSILVSYNQKLLSFNSHKCWQQRSEETPWVDLAAEPHVERSPRDRGGEHRRGGRCCPLTAPARKRRRNSAPLPPASMRVSAVGKSSAETLSCPGQRGSHVGTRPLCACSAQTRDFSSGAPKVICTEGTYLHIGLFLKITH